MDPMFRDLFILRYRMGSTGVQTSYITASSLAKAEMVGKYYCNQHINARFIKVEPAVIADEKDLPAGFELKIESASARRPKEVREAEAKAAEADRSVPVVPKQSKGEAKGATAQA